MSRGFVMKKHQENSLKARLKEALYWGDHEFNAPWLI
jgi:hypothetical protein